ncbi:MAG: hypothetical protein LBE21_00215 [Pseudomonadales bacterium]|jgi:hypothetical protein|nr:hypothetical protein [Pseudomonadales bacterium]
MSTSLASAIPPGVSTLTGSAKDVGRKLDKLDTKQQIVAITLGHVTAREAGAIAETIASIAQLVDLRLVRHEREALQSLVDTLVPKAPPTPAQLKEAAMLVQARTAVLKEAHWLTATQIAGLAGFSASNPSAQPNKWKRDGLIFAIRHHGIDYFPAYGLDPQTAYRPLKSLAQIIQLFKSAKDAWGLAYWFASANSFLGGKRPQDLLTTQPERVIAAAADELEAAAHG